ncbi:ADP-ribosyltransferase, partial [Streptomyces echinoruber]
RIIDPMTYVGKAAGAGLSKLGDIAKAIKGAGKIDMPTLPDGTVHLPDGRLLDGDGNLIGHDGTIDTTPVPHEAAPQLPAHWTIQDPQPVYAGVHTGDGVAHTTDAATDAGPRYDTTPTPSSYDHTPTPSSYNHTPTPSSYDHTPAPSSYDHPATPASYDHAPTAHDHTGTATTPHTGGHDVPGTHTTETPHGTGHDTPGGHTGDTSHGAGHDTAGHGHDGAGHGHDSGGHGHDGGGHHDGGHDGTGHTDDTGYPDAPHDPADITPHHGADATTASGHPGTDMPEHGGAGEQFEYKPLMSADDFGNLPTDADRHAVAMAELTPGTNPAPSLSNEAGQAYGDTYWNDYLDNLDDGPRDALYTYSDHYYTQINGFLRGEIPEVSSHIQHTIDEMDKVMGTRPVPEDVMVVRGTGIDHLNLRSPLEMEGNIYGDAAYTSTALGKTVPPPFDLKPVHMHLRVPKGTPALWIDHISANPGEREMLLARGTKYKVTRVFLDETDGKYHVYGEVLPRP